MVNTKLKWERPGNEAIVQILVPQFQHVSHVQIHQFNESPEAISMATASSPWCGRIYYNLSAAAFLLGTLTMGLCSQ